MDNDGANRGHEHGAEIVYGTHDDNNMVMSEKVNIDCGGHLAPGRLIFL